MNIIDKQAVCDHCNNGTEQAVEFTDSHGVTRYICNDCCMSLVMDSYNGDLKIDTELLTDFTN